MKHTKRMLAALLTLALVFAIALPSFANQSSVNWNEFRITKQPESRQNIKFGESFTLSVEVNVPEGVEVEYQWQRLFTNIEGAIESELHLDSSHPDYLFRSINGTAEAIYRCIIRAYEKDDDGNTISSKKLQTNDARVYWSDLRITKHPNDISIKHGESFTLSVEVVVPKGFEVKYQWQADDKDIEGATGSELHRDSSDPDYPPKTPRGGSSVFYRCIITVYEKDDDGNIISSIELRSGARITTETTLWGKTISFFEHALEGLMLAIVFPFRFFSPLLVLIARLLLFILFPIWLPIFIIVMFTTHP